MLQFGYWPVKGLGEKTRWLLAYLHRDYEEVNPSFGDWFNPASEKSKLSYGFAFPNVPFVIDGAVKVTESEAVNLYLVEKAGRSEMLGTTPEEKALVRSVEGVFHDVRNEIRFYFFQEDGKDKAKEALVGGKTADKVTQLDAFLEGRKGPFTLGGSEPTLADFHVAALYYQLDATLRTYGLNEGAPSMTNMKRIYENLAALAPIAAYLKTDTSKRPFCPPAFIKNIDNLVELHV
mmetsp:Transcript_12500/g.37722  ORF Transcript_12500/g.37722 Transcript_12500/m.37722 type:complete len:234 (+) Transcript_12500:269-970(+)